MSRADRAEYDWKEEPDYAAEPYTPRDPPHQKEYRDASRDRKQYQQAVQLRKLTKTPVDRVSLSQV